VIGLKGKRVLVTGGSRGIGRAICIHFSRMGCDIAFTYRRNVEAARSVQQLVEENQQECLLFKSDLTKSESINKIVKTILETWEGIDILVNNAGVWTYGEIEKMSRYVWIETMRINLDAVFETCQAVIPGMIKRKSGCIINISSTAGIRGEAFHSHYAASKGGIISFTKSLAVELAPHGIRVNAVAPGWVETDMCRGVFQKPGFRDSIKRNIPLNRIAMPEDIAGPVLFLASDLACYITGEVLNVNGGGVMCS